MKFGEIAVENALGAVLAHGIRRGDVDLKKGHVLTLADLEKLKTSDVAHVVGVRFDDDDVAEDEAAARLAGTIGGSDPAATGIRVDRAFTGRVNLFAARDGVLKLDAERINAINHIDPAITIATLPAMASVRQGQMLATVKIIPFAAPRQGLERSLEIAADGRLIEVAGFVPRRFVMIQTTLPQTPEKMLDKTMRVTEARIEEVGGRLLVEHRCRHEIDALRSTIEAAPDHEVLLIAGATAITDVRDVLPAAIEAAGGRVIHFGMPVDPGNLLLLAECGGRPVLGLPGCARSPKLNGFDWVLARIAAGIEVTADDIMGMGVGGLLAEIPSRPQPRKARTGKATTEKPRRFAAVILAAGQSRRMGKRNKLLIEIGGKPMLMHAVDAVRRSGLSPIIVVTGHERKKIEALLADEPVRIVHNPDFEEGLSTSLRIGIKALGDDVDAALVGLGDMPGIDEALIGEMIAEFERGDDHCIVVPTVSGKRGNPVLWARHWFAEMARIEGDVGARHLIGQHGDHVREVEASTNAPLIDLDTPDAVERYSHKTAE